MQNALEERMLVGTLLLSLLNSSNSRIVRSTNWALYSIIDLVKTPLVERVFAEEMDSWKIKISTAG